MNVFALYVACIAIIALIGGAGILAHDNRIRHAAVEQCNTEKLEAANAAIAEALKAEQTAHALSIARVAAREEALTKTRAASEQLEQDNAALRDAAQDRNDIVYPVGDRWLQSRNSKIGAGSGGDRQRQVPLPTAKP